MKAEFAAEMVKRVLPSYEIKEMLGEGSFGCVYRIADDLKERAVKIISLSASPTIQRGSVTSAEKKIERDFRHIVESYEKIACDEIVTVYDFFKLAPKEGNKSATAYALVVMELYPSNLHDFVIGHFEKSQQLLDIHIAESMMESLAHLLDNLYTKRGFLFEDLKPENILVKEQDGDHKLVVGDIGGLKNLGSVSASGSQVTLSYCAPEILRKGERPCLKSIIYSYGLICYFMLEGRLPYEELSVVERTDKIRNEGLSFERKDIPDYLVRAIEKSLVYDQDGRFSDFGEIVAAIRGRESRMEALFSDKTMDLDNFKKAEPKAPLPARETIAFKKPIFPGSMLGGLQGSISMRTTPVARTRVDQNRLRPGKDSMGKVDREIRDLIVRKGDMFRLQNEECAVYSDIRVEAGAMLIIENAKLFFHEDAGIISSGTLRVKNAAFAAIEPARKWRNVSVCPTDSRVSSIERSRFSNSKGRMWASLREVFHLQNQLMNDNYLYGGALFLAGVREKAMTIADSQFQQCGSHEGAGIFCLRAHPSIENSVFDSCAAGLVGGGIDCVESNPVVKACVFRNCTADKEGGGIGCISSNPQIEGCTFNVCSTRYLYGGGIYCSESNPTIKACKFVRCAAGKNGGAIFFDEKSNPRILYPAFADCRPNNTNQEQQAARDNFHFR